MFISLILGEVNRGVFALHIVMFFYRHDRRFCE